MKIERFEDIEAWKKARVLTKDIYQLSRNNTAITLDLRLKWQMTSSSTSVMSNIAEGFSRRSNKEFVQFLFIAKGSASEIQSLLYICLDAGNISQKSFDDLYQRFDHVARLLSNFILYLKRVDNLSRTPRTPRAPRTP